MKNNKSIRHILMSIKPKFVKEIFKGCKTFEFRKQLIKQESDQVIIYETCPTKKIVGYFKFTPPLVGTPQEIWGYCKNTAGISKEEFFSYYKNAPLAFAYPIKDVRILEEPQDPQKIWDSFNAPQSYKYIDGGLLNEEFCNLVYNSRIRK